MAKIGEDIELNERRQEDRANEEARREEETDFIRDDGYGEDDFARLRSDYKGRFNQDNFNLEHNGKDGYKITFPNLEDADNTYDLEEEREEIRRKINYVGFIRVLQRLRGETEFSRTRPPSYDWMKSNLFLEDIDVRFNKEGRIIGLAYRPLSERSFNIIAKKPGVNPFDLMISGNKNEKDGMQDTVENFKKRYSLIKEGYEDTPSDLSQQVVDDEFFDAEIEQSVLSDEQIWEEQKLIIQTRKGVFEEAEAKMEEYRNYILDIIRDEENGRDPFPDMKSGQDFYTDAAYISGLVSNREWYTDEGWSLEGVRPSGENFEKEMNDIADFQRVLDERIKRATSGKQLEVYETLRKYLDYKKVSLYSYFDKKIEVNKITELYRRLQRTKLYRRGVIRAVRWVAERFPKALAGAVLGVITTAFGIYETVEDMAGDVVKEGTKAINNISKKEDNVVKEQKKMIDKAVGNLDKRLKDAAEKQGKLVKDALDGLRKTLQPSSKLLKFLLDHILWLIIAFVLWMIYITFLLMRRKRLASSAQRSRVRVKYEHESSDEEGS